MIEELKKAVDMLEEDRKVSSVILKGSSNNFIGGADINEMVGANALKAYQFAKEMNALHERLIHSSKPYIAAIKGFCLGGGLELALACDIRLVDSTAKLGLPEINLGIIPGGGGIQRLLDITGISFTSQLAMTGRMVTADEAHRLSIASLVNGEVYEEAIAIAESIAEKSQLAIATLKRLINQRKRRQAIAEIEEEILEFSLLFDHPDSLEGMSAFLQKRQPFFNREMNNVE